jgi:hypothetical protein
MSLGPEGNNMINRSLMIYAMMGYLILWYGGAILAIKFLGMDPIEALGIGTAGGVFVASFKDSWQFIWRKSSPKEDIVDTKGK